MAFALVFAAVIDIALLLLVLVVVVLGVVVFMFRGLGIRSLETPSLRAAWPRFVDLIFVETLPLPLAPPLVFELGLRLLICDELECTAT